MNLGKVYIFSIFLIMSHKILRILVFKIFFLLVPSQLLVCHSQGSLTLQFEIENNSVFF